jgi:steroid delta-isomerase-like uncharacterized protein
MLVEENKAIIRRLVRAEEIGDWATVDELTAPNYVYHNPSWPVLTHEEHKQQVLIGFMAAFPDVKYNIEDMIAEGNYVVIRYSIIGTHKGEFAGIPPTNKRIELTSLCVFRLADGKVAEQWVENNSLVFMKQLGVIPLPAGYFHIKE